MKKLSWVNIICLVVDLIGAAFLVLCVATDLNDDLYLVLALGCVSAANVTNLIWNIRRYRKAK